MELGTVNETLEYCTTFVHSLKDTHFKNVDVSFRKDSDYTDYDEMLKRNIVYSSFNVNESLCKCIIGLKNNLVEMKFSQNDSFSKPEQITDSFLSFLRKYIYNESNDNTNSNLKIKTHYFTGNVLLSKDSQNAFSFLSDTVQIVGNNLYEEVTRLSQNLKQSLQEWLYHLPDVNVFISQEVINPGEICYVVSVSVLFSKIDVDCSTDIDHTVFRWQETSLFKNAIYTENSLQDCIQILEENGLTEPANGVVSGIMKFEVDDNCSCLVLRYAHKIKDLDFSNIQENSTDKPIYRSAGCIVFENDFWEFYIDCSTRKVISENRKWRKIVGYTHCTGSNA
jgi:hypothetical protein